MSEAFVQAEQSVAIIFVRDECLCCQLHLVAEMRSSFSHQGVSENCTAFWPLGGADNTGIKAALQPLQDDPSSPPPTLKKEKKKKSILIPPLHIIQLGERRVLSPLCHRGWAHHVSLEAKPST